MDDLIISVFYESDNFCKKFIPYMEQQCIQADNRSVSLELPSRLTLSETMTICAVFYLSGYRTFKWFCRKLILTNYKKFFPDIVSYNRFVELMPYTAFPMVFFAYSRSGKCIGISFVDSTTIDVCDNHRIQQHKVFKDIAQRGKSSTGRFYGFKLHISTNEHGEIPDFCLTPGNKDDRNPVVMEHLTENIFGKLFADKGYISKKLAGRLRKNGIQLVTKQKKNTRTKGLMELSDKILLRKHAVIESVNDFLKNICRIEHSRHRSCCNFVVNLVSSITAYSFLPKKPSIQPCNNAIPCKIL